MKFPFGRKKPKEKLSNGDLSNDSATDSQFEPKKRLSSCSDTELSKEDKPSFMRHVRRRGSDTGCSKSSKQLDAKEIDHLITRMEPAGSITPNPDSPPLPTLKLATDVGHGDKRSGLLPPPKTQSDMILEEFAFSPSEDSTEHDRGWLTEDTLQDEDSDDRNKYNIRVFRLDSSFATIACQLRTRSSDLLKLLGRKFFVQDVSNYALYLRKQNIERVLTPDERPLVILKRMLEKMGYTNQDDLKNLGREDNSYYFKFVFDLDKTNSLEDEQEIPNFQHVDLRAKNLRKLPLKLSQNVDQVQSLNLSQNLVLDLSLEFFTECKSLKEFMLSRCELRNVPECIRVLPTLTFLDLSSNRIKSVPYSKLGGLVNLTSLDLSNNRVEVLPSQLAQLTNLTNLNLSNNRFSLFPTVITNLTNLITLDISFNEIRSLPPSLGQLKSLQHLLLISNRISGLLPPSLLHLSALTELDVRKNQINNLDVLSSLPNLELLLCDYNSMSTLPLKFQALSKLNISKNSITRLVSPNEPINTLVSLNLSFSKLVSLPDDLFEHLPNLEDLILDNNRLVSLPASIGKLKNLVTLNCSNNELSSLTGDIASLTSLKLLDLHDNNLSALPIELWELKSLTTFNASSNLLKEFPRPPTQTIILFPHPSRTASANSEDLVQPPLALSLKELFLGDNRLTDDVFGPLSMFSELKLLNLSYNILDDIPPGSLLKLSNLNELYISGNQLSTLPSEDLEKLRGLKALYLNGNRLQTLPAELGKLGKLHTLDVGNNALKYNICNFPYDWNWNWNKGLRYLNLSGNKRLQIKHNLSENSTFSHLNLPDFNNLVQLRVLGLMDVTLMVEAPPETQDRRIRISPNQTARMSFGISDRLRKDNDGEGRWDKVWTWDKTISHFRGQETVSLYALFDGHSSRSGSGSRIAKFLNDNIEQYLHHELNGLKKGEDMTFALRRSFLTLNKELGTLGLDESGGLGASGVVAYISGTTLYVANVGDTVAVICRNAGTAHLISTRHTPWSTDEISRIRNNKGFISPQGLLNGELEISRGFGHFHLSPLINANPSMEAIQLTESDEFVILATRSLWDKMSYQTAVDVARMEADNPMVAAQKVRDFAMIYGADDSVAVMIISVSDLFAYRDSPNHPPALGIPRGVDDSNLGLPYKRNRWRNQGPGSSKLARLGGKNDEAPVGEVALVFTDIKNSTFLWETLPTAMRFAVKSHNLAMRRWLISLGGYEVKTEGDAFRASFPTVQSALLWCLTMQVQLTQLDWPQEILDSSECAEISTPGPPAQVLYRGLSVRMGIHFGTPQCEPDPVTNRMDYVGFMVKRSDSICTAADGGQISVSSEVIAELAKLDKQFPPSALEDISEAPLPRDIRMLRKIGYAIFDLGEVKLKGLENTEQISMIYPKALSERHTQYLTAKAPIKPIKHTIRAIDPTLVKALGYQCLRLERLAAGTIQPKRASRMDCLYGFLTFQVKDEYTDSQLITLTNSLITRIENACTKLYIQHLLNNQSFTLPSMLKSLIDTIQPDLIHDINSEKDQLTPPKTKPLLLQLARSDSEISNDTFYTPIESTFPSFL